MSKTIWEFPLQLVRLQNVQMPAGAELLTVQTQPDIGVRDGYGGYIGPVLWAVVDLEMPNMLVTIAMYGNNEPIPDNPGRYLATIQTQRGAFVWHVFAPGSI